MKTHSSLDKVMGNLASEQDSQKAETKQRIGNES